MKIAWPCPAFIAVKHIAHVFCNVTKQNQIMDKESSTLLSLKKKLKLLRRKKMGST